MVALEWISQGQQFSPEVQRFWLLLSVCLYEQCSPNLQLFWTRKYLQTFRCLFMHELNVQLWIGHISFTCCFRQFSPNLQKPHCKYLQDTSIFRISFLCFWNMKLFSVFLMLKESNATTLSHCSITSFMSSCWSSTFNLRSLFTSMAFLYLTFLPWNTVFLSQYFLFYHILLRD